MVIACGLAAKADAYRAQPFRRPTAACVAAAQGDARPVDPEGSAEIRALLDERRINLSGSRTGIDNQLHALLRQLLAGGAPTSLTAAAATNLLWGLRVKSAARPIGRTGRRDRFPTAAAFANYNGSAPVQIAGADTDRHRLSRYGDRQLNSALYTVAVVQIRMPASAGRAYYDKKISEGKKPAAARRAPNVTFPITSGASCFPMEDLVSEWQAINLPGRLDKQRGAPAPHA